MVLLIVGLLGGCAASRIEGVASPEVVYDDAQAAALVFDTPVGHLLPPQLLQRDGRGEAAYWGLQGPTTTYHYIRTDDRWGNYDYRGNFGDHYRRRAVMMQLGVSVRP